MPMRVMLFADTYPPQINGVASSVSTLARALHRQGHAVMVCTAGRRGPNAEGDEPFPVVRVPAMRLPLYGDFTVAPPLGRTFARMVRGFEPEIIHCHTPFGVGWRGALAAHAAGIPLAGTHHTLFGAYVAAYLRLGRRVNARIAAALRRYVAGFYNQCDVVTCASRYLARDLVSGGLTRPVTIVPNALDTERFRPLPHAAEHASGRRIMWFGRLAAEKNLPRLVRLVEPVLRHHPDVCFEVAGDGPLRGALETLVCERGLERQVRFAGWLRGEELVAHVAGSDLCVSASLTENQPMALLESLACGVPVVALAAAGVPEIIADGTNGLLVAPDCAPETLAGSIERVLADGDLRRRLVAGARASAEVYSQATCLRQTLAAYHQAAVAHSDRTARRGVEHLLAGAGGAGRLASTSRRSPAVGSPAWMHPSEQNRQRPAGVV